MALTPAEQKELDALEEEERVQNLANQISPDLDPVPQVLATLPTTNHAGGDEGAEAAWMRKPGGDSKGVVFAYEPPLDYVKKRYAEDPAFLAAVFPSLPPDPQMIASMTRDSAEYQAGAAKLWQETADAATANGKTAYRYAFTPWLQGTKAMGALDMLKGALSPAASAVNSFVMGADDIALLGAGRAVDEKLSSGNPRAIPGVEQAGIPEENAAAYNEHSIEEHPIAHTAGQVAGFVSPGGLVNLGRGMYDLLAKAGRAVASKAPTAAGLATRVVAGGVASGAGAGAVTAGQGAVRGDSPAQIGQDATAAALDPLNLGLGAGGEALGALANRGAVAIREAPRYGGNIGRAERLGAEVQYGKGPTAPGVDEAVQAGRNRPTAEAEPIDVVAKRNAPVLAQEVKRNATEKRQEIGAVKEKFYPTREGQMRLPPAAMQAETLKELDRTHSPTRGRLRPIGTSKDEARELKTIFNGNVETVTTKPVEGAIELNPDQAEAYLLPMFKGKLVSEITPKATPKTAEAQGGAREIDLGGEANKYDLSGKTLEDLGHKTTQPEKAQAVRDSKGKQEPIDLIDDPERGLRLVDGRHRFTVARERGDATIDAVVREPGTGKVLFKGKLPLGAGPSAADAATVPPKGKAAKPAGKVAAQPTREADTVKMQEPPEGPGKDEYGQATRPHREAQRADNARAQALAEEMGIPGTESIEPPQRLADTLKKQGIDKVYVVPRRYNAENQDALIDRLRTTSREAVSAKQRVAEKLYALALKDRDARPMNGQTGGWSAKQQEHRKILDAVDAEEAAAGDTKKAFGSIVGYGTQQQGQLLNMEALEGAGKRAGIGDELRLARLLDPMGTLQAKTGLHKPAHAAPPTTLYGALSAGADALTLRLLYPGLRDLGAAGSPIRGGRAGRAGMVGRDDEKKDKTP